MSDLSVTKTRIQAGVWEGVLTTTGTGDIVPDVIVLYQQKPLDKVEFTEDPDQTGRFFLRVPIPIELLSDGVQAFVIADGKTGETLDRFTIITGQPMEDDIRAEMELLRAELDMLKRAFRRHCIETM